MPARLAGAVEPEATLPRWTAAGPAQRGSPPEPPNLGQEPRGGSPPWPVRAAVLADDLTGALDGGVQLLRRTAVEVLVSPGAGGPTGPEADTAQGRFRHGAAPRAANEGASTVPAADPADRAPENAAPASDATSRAPAGPAAGMEDATATAAMRVINTQSRGLAPVAAAARVRAVCRALRAQGRTVWFKKLDSTLRGNVGAELAALHEALAPCVIVCTPALPAEGRTVQGGVLRVAGEPVMATPYRDEIPTGAGDAIASEIGSTTCRKTCRDEIPAGAGDAGSSAVIDVVRRQWPECRAAHLPARPRFREFAGAVHGPVDLVVVDAASDADLSALAEVAGGVGRGARRLVWAGSAGLLHALAVTGALEPEVVPRDYVADGGVRSESVPRAPLILVCGSRRILSHSQVDRAAGAASRPLMLHPIAVPGTASDAPRWQISGARDVGAAAFLNAADAAEISAVALAQGRDLFLCAPPLTETTASQRPPAAEMAELVAAGLADLAARALAAAAVRPRALLLVGGDTAYACLRRLGIHRLELGGEAEPYVPWACVTDGAWAGLVLLTKAGGFGDPHTLHRICAQLPQVDVEAGQRPEAGRRH